MGTERNEYPLKLTINNRKLTSVIIDQHYRQKHSEITDVLILKLVQTLHGGIFPIEEQDTGFEYFVVAPVVFEGKPYRLVLLLCLHDEFLGVINAFRLKKKNEKISSAKKIRRSSKPTE